MSSSRRENAELKGIGENRLKHLMYYYKKLSITQKLLLLFGIQVIIPLMFMGMMLYKNTETIIESKCVSYTADLLKMVELRLGDFSESLTTITDDMLYDQNISDCLEQPSDRKANQRIKQACYQSLRRVCKSSGKLQTVAIVSLSGIIHQYDLNAGNMENNAKQMPLDEMFLMAKQAKGSASWYVQPTPNGQADLYMVRMIYNVDDFKEIGMIILKVNREKLKNVYSDLSVEFMNGIQILSQNHEWLIGMSQNELTADEIEWLNGQDKEWNYLIDPKSRQMIAYMNIEETPWQVVAKASLKELFSEEMDRFRSLFVLVMICTVLLLFGFSLLMAMDILEPIKQLVTGIQKFEEQNVHEEIRVDREDELGYLSRCFNKMSSEIDNLLNRVYKEQLTRKEAELKALQAQINPHFLFNTLESINWMAQLNDVPEIRDMVTSLSELMEASIGKGNPMIPLSKELKYIDSYLTIMKYRYGDRLAYESRVEPCALHQEVPKLILQPLIENAIYHGVDKVRKKCLIELTVEKQEDQIYIEIKDNGKGIKPEEVRCMNEQFEENRRDYFLEKHSKGIGLANVNSRLKLFFGQKYGLMIESEYEHYTKITLCIPIISKGENAHV